MLQLGNSTFENLTIHCGAKGALIVLSVSFTGNYKLYITYIVHLTLDIQDILLQPSVTLPQSEIEMGEIITSLLRYRYGTSICIILFHNFSLVNKVKIWKSLSLKS